MMKAIWSTELQSLIFVLVFVTLFVISSDDTIQIASADEIPYYLKNKIRLWTNNQGDNFDFLQTIGELNRLGLLKSHPTNTYSLKDTYFLPVYGGMQFVEIEGRTPNVKQTNPVVLIVTKPDGSELELSASVLESGAYSTTMILDHNSALGAYKIIAYHSGKEISQDEFHLVKSNSTPFWIRAVARWWIEDKISEKEFLDGLDYLINNRIVVTRSVVNFADDTLFNVTIDGHKAVRRGTMQDISVQVTNSNGPVANATVFVRVEDYGEDILDEFRGITDSDGNYHLSWEIGKDEFNDIETLLVYVDVTDGTSSKTKLFTFEVYCLCGEPNCRCRN